MCATPDERLITCCDAESVELTIDYYLHGLLLTFSEQISCNFNVGFHLLHSLQPDAIKFVAVSNLNQTL